MTNTLLNKDETQVANYIILQAKKYNLSHVTNLELNSIIAFLEGWSLSVYHKSLCTYQHYFKIAPLDTIILPRINSFFGANGSGSLNSDSQYIYFEDGKLKIPMIYDGDIAEPLFDKFNTLLRNLLFYEHVTSQLVKPLLNSQDINEDKLLNVPTSNLPSIDKNMAISLYDNNINIVNESGNTLFNTYEHDINDGFPAEIVNTSDGQDLVREVKKLCYNNPDKNKYIKLISKAYELGTKNPNYDDDDF